MTTRNAIGCAVLASLAMASGCAIGLGKSLHEYSMLDVQKLRDVTSRPVSVEESDEAILGFVLQTDYVDKARERLLSTCAHGELVNVRIRHSTDLGFFAYRRKIRMDAVCLEGVAPAPGP